MLFAFPDASDPDPMAGITDAERASFAAAAAGIADGTGYTAIQSTKPETLAYGLPGSPTGVAASAARLYAESCLAGTAADQPWIGRVDVPTDYFHQPYELMQTPRAWAEKRDRIVHWVEQARGGRFACCERPG